MLLEKTALGVQVLKDRSVPLSPQQRSAFILIDGKRTAADILRSTAGVGVTTEDILHLIAVGVAAEIVVRDEVAEAEASEKGRASPEDRYRAAYPIAVALTSGLGFRGVRLNLAVEGARSYEDLMAVALKIKETVGDEKFEPLRKALKG